MSTEDPVVPASVTPDPPTRDADVPMDDDAQATAQQTKKRPRLDLAVEPRERKRGKTAFGLVLGTLNRAKNEDRARGASEAAKKRQLIEQRLQDKLRKETDSVRRAEEVKKDKTTANRKEEELQLKDSIHKLRRARFPLLANFLCTSDDIPTSNADMDVSESRKPLGPVLRTYPPPLYYLPARLTPAQEVFLQRRKAEAKEAAEQEWEAFRTERAAGVEEIVLLRQRVAEEDARRRAEQEAAAAEKEKAKAKDKVTTMVDDRPMHPKKEEGPPTPALASTAEKEAMDVDDGDTKEAAPIEGEPERETKEEVVVAPLQADDDDAVEY